MDDEKKVILLFCIFGSIALIALTYTIIPTIFGSDVEKDITIIFNDNNGALDSCGNFYYSADTNAMTRAKLNMIMPKMDSSPVIVKVIIREPLKGLPLSSDAPCNRPYIKDVLNVFPTPGDCDGK